MITYLNSYITDKLTEPQFKGTASWNFLKYTVFVNMQPMNTIIYLANYFSSIILKKTERQPKSTTSCQPTQTKPCLLCCKAAICLLSPTWTFFAWLSCIFGYPNFPHFFVVLFTHRNPFLCKSSLWSAISSWNNSMLSRLLSVHKLIYLMLYFSLSPGQTNLYAS